MECTWTPPQYTVTHLPPKSIHVLTPPPDPSYPGNFIRSAKWCPDGSSALCQQENSSFIFLKLHTTETPEFLQPLVQPSPILDYAWYPFATPLDPASHCFLASVRECPIRLVDASDGRLRASYKIVDHRERQVAPHSLCFNLTADKIYAGFDSSIEIFSIHRPGTGTRILTSPNKKSKDGMKGIISSISFSPSGTVYAAGSLSPSLGPIAIYDAGTDEVGVYLGLGDQERKAVGGGVTQLQFNPTHPHILYASFRRSPHIYAWDIRASSGEPFAKYRFVKEGRERTMTNQKLKFDIELGGLWLSVGNQDGEISVFSLETRSHGEADIETYGSVKEIHPTLQYKTHSDTIGSVSFHPLKTWVLSVSGSRHWDREEAIESDELEEESEEELEDGEGVVSVKPKDALQPVPFETSVKIWEFEGGGDRSV